MDPSGPIYRNFPESFEAVPQATKGSYDMNTAAVPDNTVTFGTGPWKLYQSILGNTSGRDRYTGTQGIRMQQSFYAYGQWTTGNMMVTAMPEFTINSWDRLTLSNGVGRFTERVVRQPGSTVDVLRYNPLCVLYVGWVSRPPANTLTTFQCGVDFDVSQDGSSIEWLGTNQPDAGSFYSVDYEYRPRYVVQELVHHHRVSTVQGKHYVFPVQAVAKLDYLIRDVSADPQQVVDHNPFDPPAGR